MKAELCLALMVGFKALARTRRRCALNRGASKKAIPYQKAWSGFDTSGTSGLRSRPENIDFFTDKKTLNRRIRNVIPKPMRRLLDWASARRRGASRLRNKKNWPDSSVISTIGRPAVGPLETYFNSLKEGPGIWKWRHYFDIYHRHLSKFVGRQPRVLEIGVYSGGSLDMWKSYFGEKCIIHGVDIEPACKSYEKDSVKILIGDQADRRFWKQVRNEVPLLDVVIDDGGHRAKQQIVTLEETLPHLRPGGVYICEDIHGTSNEFLSYVDGLSENLHAYKDLRGDLDNERRQVSLATTFQAAVASIHMYPFAVVIERTDDVVKEFVGSKHGTQWQPFLE